MGGNLFVGENDDIQIKGATDSTLIGNTGDRLKVDASFSVASPLIAHINRQDASGTKTVSGNSGTLDSAGFTCLTFELRITAASGTSPILQVALESSDDGTNWSEFTNTTQFSTTGSFRHQRLALGAKYYRYTWTISGASPSFTFTINTTLKSVLPNRNVSISKYQNLQINSLNALSSVFNAADCSNISVSTVRSDDGGSNTQYVVQASTNGINWNNITGNISQGRGTVLNTDFSAKAYRFYRLQITAAANVLNYLDIFWVGNS